MGSRGRSIRLRIYFLVAIPLVTMLALFAAVAYTSITNFQNLDRAPALVRATGEPAATAMGLVNTERTDAVIYLSAPSATNRAAYEAAVKATKSGAAAFGTAMEAPGVKSSETPAEAAAINKMVSDLNGMNALRLGVLARKLSPVDALDAYTNITSDVPDLYQAESESLTNASAVEQGLGEVAVDNNDEDIQEQVALLAGAFASGALSPQARVAFDQAAGREQDDTLLVHKLLSPTELAVYNTVYDEVLGNKAKTVTAAYTGVQDAVEAGLTLPEIVRETGVSGPDWETVAAGLAEANYKGGLAAAAKFLVVDEGIANSARRTVYLTGAIGAAGLILTLIVTMLLGRSINRRLRILRVSARTLATEQLPGVITRLRRGETVDVAAEAPPLRVGADEIGQVGQAIELVRQSAIRSAVEESKLRQGINDMFRNLARRNQSLLQRQLTVLDAMERRATDPDLLDDLFKMDHLTTRMRRHAEGLIILSGAVPGRSWSNPVKLIDVMRGAVAEVEDFARVTVSTQSRAMLAGSSVTDVIHLLAELIENATSLSPPFTQVRVTGESVSNGFAIEIEDRGLGLTPNRMAELNERLANPPEVNPANTEQLGLFVVGQLARRHGITIMLRPSPYGGTTAVTLIPQRLVVDENTPTRKAAPAAIGAGPGAPTPRSAGAAPADSARADQAPANGFGPGDAYPTAAEPSAHRPFPKRRLQKRARGSGMVPAGTRSSTPPPAPTGPTRPGEESPAYGTVPDLDNIPLSSPFGTRLPPAAQQQPAADIPVVTGVPIWRASAHQSPDYFTRPSSYGNGSPYGNGHSNGHGPAGYMGDSAYGVSADFGTGSPPDGNGGSAADLMTGNNGDGGGSYPNASSDGPGGRGGSGGEGGEINGLPRRVRQANLAPQLRSSPASGGTGGASVPQAVPPNPADVRNTFSAMQRGWQQGRTQQNRNSEDSN